MTSKLRIYYQNARGLRTKTHMLKRNINLSSYDVISITESWLPDSIHDSEFIDDRYVIWRRDRNYAATRERFGGGVFLAVRRELSAVERPEWCSSAEDIWVTVTTMNKDRTLNKIHFCTLYLCNQNLGNTFNTQLTNFSDKLFCIINSCPNDTFIILGDFNMSNVEWLCNQGNLQPSGIAGDSQIYFSIQCQ